LYAFTRLAPQHLRRFRLAPTERAHHRGPRHHGVVVVLGDRHQRLGRRLPLRGIVLGLRERGDISPGIALGRRSRSVPRHLVRFRDFLIRQLGAYPRPCNPDLALQSSTLMPFPLSSASGTQS